MDGAERANRGGGPLGGTRLCLAMADNSCDRCHETLTRDGDEWVCRAGHRWDRMAQQVRTPPRMRQAPPVSFEDYRAGRALDDPPLPPPERTPVRWELAAWLLVIAALALVGLLLVLA